MYCMDLIYLLAKRYYDGLPGLPSELAEKKHKVDDRSAEQIAKDTIKGLGGE